MQFPNISLFLVDDIYLFFGFLGDLFELLLHSAFLVERLFVLGSFYGFVLGFADFL